MNITTVDYTLSVDSTVHLHFSIDSTTFVRNPYHNHYTKDPTEAIVYSQSSNLFYFGARYYDPELGNWTSTDPAEQFFDSYSYAKDPINYVDPDGQWIGTTIFCAIMGVAGGIATYKQTGSITKAINPFGPDHYRGVANIWNNAWGKHYALGTGYNTDQGFYAGEPGNLKYTDWKTSDGVQFEQSLNDAYSSLRSVTPPKIDISGIFSYQKPQFEIGNLTMQVVESSGGTVTYSTSSGSIVRMDEQGNIAVEPPKEMYLGPRESGAQVYTTTMTNNYAITGEPGVQDVTGALLLSMSPLLLSTKMISATTTLYRAVGPAELADIQATNVIRNLGLAEGKYFTTSAKDAASYAKQAVKGFGDPAYTIIKTNVSKSIFKGLTPATVDRGIPAWVIPNQRLQGLVPKILDQMPIP
jgi:RHS repeat-associated protein